MEFVDIVALGATAILIYVVALETRFDKFRGRYEEEMKQSWKVANEARLEVWRLHLTVESLLDGDLEAAREFFSPDDSDTDDDSMDRYS